MRSTSDALANLITEIRDEQADDRIYMRAELKQVKMHFIFILTIFSDANRIATTSNGFRASSRAPSSLRKRRGRHEHENKRPVEVICKYGDRF